MRSSQATCASHVSAKTPVFAFVKHVLRFDSVCGCFPLSSRPYNVSNVIQRCHDGHELRPVSASISELLVLVVLANFLVPCFYNYFCFVALAAHLYCDCPERGHKDKDGNFHLCKLV